MVSITFDTVKLDDLKIKADFLFDFEKAEQGLVECSFKIDGIEYEYNEWFNNDDCTLDKTDRMHPTCTSDKAAAFNNYLNRINDKEDRGWNCEQQLIDSIEQHLKLKKPDFDMQMINSLLSEGGAIETIAEFIAETTNSDDFTQYVFLTKNIIDLVREDGELDGNNGLALQIKCGFTQEQANKIISFVNFEVERITLVERFNAELEHLDISQNEFCRSNGVSAQGVIKWKKTGTFPLWVWNALRGMKTDI